MTGAILINQRFVIAGGSGFVGLSLAHHLSELGAQVTILSRSAPRTSHAAHAQWDGRTLDAWAQTLDGTSGLINLAGRTVDCIKSPDHIDEILRSRVESTLVLGQACRAIKNPPPVWVQMSTAHIYGDPPSARCTEDSPHGYGLAPFVGNAWEAAFNSARLASQRPVILRTGFVLGRDRGAGGGALARLRFLASIGLGGTVGTGTQGMSWVHEHDMNRIFERSLTNPAAQGIYNAAGPKPTSQREFMRSLRRTMRMPIGLPAFSWMVRIGAPLVLKTDPELALYGRYVLPERLKAEGFTFDFDDLDRALADLASPSARKVSPAQAF